MRNEEKGKGREGTRNGRESCKRTDTREEAKMRPRTGSTGTRIEPKKRKRKGEIDRSREIPYLNSKQYIVTVFRFCHRVHNTRYRITGTYEHACGARSLVASVRRDIKNGA